MGCAQHWDSKAAFTQQFDSKFREKDSDVADVFECKWCKQLEMRLEKFNMKQSEN